MPLVISISLLKIENLFNLSFCLNCYQKKKGVAISMDYSLIRLELFVISHEKISQTSKK